MTQPAVMHVFGLPQNARYTLLRGPLKTWLQSERIPAQHSAAHRGWYVRTERVGDIMARAERAGIVVKMRGALT